LVSIPHILAAVIEEFYRTGSNYCVLLLFTHSMWRISHLIFLSRATRGDPPTLFFFLFSLFFSKPLFILFLIQI